MTKEQTIDLSPPQNKILQKILRQQIPNKTVWAFGSRVEWKASETSDLDLVAHKCSGAEIADLKEALEESALHCSVDVLNWEDIPDSFRANIKKHYVVVQQYTVPEGWRGVKLGDVVKSNSRTIGKNYPHKEILYLDTGSITENRISDFQSYIIAEAPTRAKRLVVDKNIIYSMVRPIQRHYGFIKKPPNNLVVSTGFSVIEVDKKIAEPLFIYFLLSSNQVVKKLDSIAEGATSAYPSLRPEDIENLHVLLPSLSEQKAIAEVLSSLDDKIDLLRRQNKTLEDMAQTLFCKWFWGGISDGWEIKALDEIADYLNGLACQKHPPQNDKDKLPVLKIRELKNGISENSDWATSAVDDKYIINLGDIVFSWSGSLMVKLWDGEKCVLNQHLFKVSSECYPNWYIYFWTKHYISKFIQIADSKATTMGHIKREDLSSSVVKVPKPDELSAMNKKILPQFQKMVLNYKQIRALEELRDMLLSKLITGEMRL